MKIDSKKKNCIFILFFVLVGSWAYSNTLQVPFYFDDIQNIVENSAIRLKTLSLNNLINAGQESTVASRPLANISFALNYYFHQLDVKGFHLVNIAIHILTAIFLFCLFQNLLTSPAVKREVQHENLIAFFAALLWLVHPIQTQAVTYIVQRMTSMAAMFYVLSMLCYTYARLTHDKRRALLWYACCIVAGIMAIASKEIAATLPFFLLLYEWFFYQDMDGAWLKRRKLFVAALALLFLLLSLYFLGENPFDKVLAGYKYKDYTWMQRLLTQPRVIFFYLGLFLLPLPSRFSLEHDLPFSEALLSPPVTLFAIVAVIALCVCAIVLARKYRLVSFAIFWFLGNLVIESSIIPLELVFEHRMYMPSMFLGLLIALFFFQNLNTRLAVVALAVLVLLCSGWTHARNAVWREPMLFHQSNAANAPNNYRAHYNYGLELYKDGQYEAAIQEFTKTLELEPRHLFANLDLGLAYTMAGEYENALKYFNKLLLVVPNHAPTYVARGYLYARQGAKANALINYEKALQFDPGNADTHKRIGYLYANAGQYEQAIVHFREVLNLSSQYRFEMNNSLGIAFAALGQYDLAVEHFSGALLLDPENRQVQYNLELARQKKLEMK